jgi:hypothetical protein
MGARCLVTCPGCEEAEPVRYRHIGAGGKAFPVHRIGDEKPVNIVTKLGAGGCNTVTVALRRDSPFRMFCIGCQKSLPIDEFVAD